MYDKLRAPRFHATAERWKILSKFIDPNIAGGLDELVGLPTKRQLLDYGSGYYEARAEQEVRVTVGRLAIRTFARSLEVVEGAGASRLSGSNVSSLLLSYDAVYLAASTMVLLFGYAPIGRDSEVCVDIFYKSSQPRIALEDTYGFFVLDRWSHEVVWKLCKRIISTIDTPAEIKDCLKVLRSDKLDKVSQRRNSQIYDQAKLYAGDDKADADFPSLQPVLDASWAVDRYRAIFHALSKINLQLVVRADLEKHLVKLANSQRRKVCSVL